MKATHSKRILMVSHYYPPHPGGIELVAQNQAERLAARGYSVTVVTSSVAADQTSGTYRRVKVQRVKAWNILEKYAIPFPLFSLRLLPLMWREVGQADVVHIHDVFYLSSLCAAVCAVWRKKPIVLTQHVAVVPHSWAANLVQRLVYATTGRFIFRRARRVMILNDRVEQFALHHGVPPAALRFLPIGTDCQLFHPPNLADKRSARQRFNLPLAKPVVLFVGRAVPKKGYDKVLAAESDDYLLVFAGGVFNRKDTARARFLGQVPQPVMADIFRVADIYVLPSEGEGFPMTVQEAMASGLPVVFRDDPGYRRYRLTAQVAYLLKRTDPVAIRRVLRLLLADAPRRRRMGAKARRYALTHFRWDKIIDQLAMIYDEASPGIGAVQ